jgi:hypothetical protein
MFINNATLTVTFVGGRRVVKRTSGELSGRNEDKHPSAMLEQLRMIPTAELNTLQLSSTIYFVKKRV